MFDFTNSTRWKKNKLHPVLCMFLFFVVIAFSATSDIAFAEGTTGVNTFTNDGLQSVLSTAIDIKKGELVIWKYEALFNNPTNVQFSFGVENAESSAKPDINDRTAFGFKLDTGVFGGDSRGSPDNEMLTDKWYRFGEGDRDTYAISPAINASTDKFKNIMAGRIRLKAGYDIKGTLYVKLLASDQRIATDCISKIYELSRMPPIDEEAEYAKIVTYLKNQLPAEFTACRKDPKAFSPRPAAYSYAAEALYTYIPDMFIRSKDGIDPEFFLSIFAYYLKDRIEDRSSNATSLMNGIYNILCDPRNKRVEENLILRATESVALENETRLLRENAAPKTTVSKNTSSDSKVGFKLVLPAIILVVLLVTMGIVQIKSRKARTNEISQFDE